jgi:hypothetical protein
MEGQVLDAQAAAQDFANTAWDGARPANPGKNPWRPVLGMPGVHEMCVGHGRRAIYDASRQEEVGKHTWFLNKPEDANSYIVTSTYDPVTKRKHGSMFLHRYLFANEIEAYELDHLGRNSKHVNTRANLRSGDNGMNRRTAELKNDGVLTDEKYGAYTATWTDKHTQPQSKRFRWADYPTKELAYAAAAAHRQREANAVMSEIIELQVQAKREGKELVIPRYKPKPQTSNTGVKGLHYTESVFGRLVINGSIKINKKQHVASFYLSQYHDDYDEALAAGVAWRKKMEATRPPPPPPKPTVERTRKNRPRVKKLRRIDPEQSDDN